MDTLFRDLRYSLRRVAQEPELFVGQDLRVRQAELC